MQNNQEPDVRPPVDLAAIRRRYVSRRARVPESVAAVLAEIAFQTEPRR